MLARLNLLQVRRVIITGSLLAFVAGLVNSVGFIAFGSYVSHVSGHATRAAMEFSEGHAAVALVFFLATASFVVGSVITTLLLHGRFLTSDRAHAVLPIFIETLLIAFVTVTVHLQGRVTVLSFGSWSAASVYLLSIAMGMQNALFRLSSGVIVRTTHMTGMATDMGMTIGHVIDLLWRKFHRNSDRTRVMAHDRNLNDLIKNMILYFSLFVSFLFGAMAGTFGFFGLSIKILYLAVAVLLLAAVYTYRTALPQDSKLK